MWELWLLIIGLFVLLILNNLFPESRTYRFFPILIFIFGTSAVLFSYLLLPAFYPVELTEQGIFYPFQVIRWEEVESYNWSQWEEDTFYIDRQQFRVPFNKKDEVKPILSRYLPDDSDSRS